MTELQLTLFGVPIVTLDNHTITIRRRKEAALLYYLACVGTAVARDHLFELLSGDGEDSAAARRYFNVSIHRLARLLPDCITIDREMLGFAPTCTVGVDVSEFSTTVIAFQAGDDPAPLQAVVDRYRGEFLEGFSMRGATAFKEWMLLERENLHQLLIQALIMLTAEYERRQDTTRGIAAAQRLLALEPWHEIAHRQLMLLMARDGQYQAALTQFDICCRVLAEELGVDPMPETVELYERLQTTATPPPHNLPPAMTPFVGREVELVQIYEHLTNPHCRLLTLLGLGGVGKTHLALEVARYLVNPDPQRFEHPFPDGVYYVSLIGVEGTTLADPAAVSEAINRVAIAIGQALDLTFTGRLSPPAQLLAALHDRQLLLLLDNYEHLNNTVELLLDLLHHVPGLTLLITSRERLNLDEEWMLMVRGLPLPTTPEEVPTAAASRLFIQEARRTQLTWDYMVVDALPITKLCRLVDGLPLAIKLAAAALRYTTCAALVDEIIATFDGLQTTLRNVPERHRSLRAVMAYSWVLLRPDEQALLRRIAVFHGGFNDAAAHAVTQLSPRHLAGLVDKSLVSLDDSGRYTLHEMVRQFATEQLATVSDEIAETAVRHAHYYANIIAQYTQQLSIVTELGNIRAAWQWATTHRAWETLAQMQPHLAAFYERTGLLQEGEAAFAQAVTHLSDMDVPHRLVFHISYARFLGLRSQYARALQVLIEHEPQVALLTDYDLMALYHEQRGWVLANQSDYANAIAYIARARTLYEETRNTQGVARSAYYLGDIARRQGDYQQAVMLLEAAQQHLVSADLAVAHRGPIVIDVYRELGMAHKRQGRPEAARDALLESLNISQRQHDRLREAMALNNLGTLAQEQRSLFQARDYFRQALTLRWQMGDRSGEATTRFNLAGIDHDLGNYSQARDGMHAALAIFEEIGDQWSAVNVWNALGILYQELGDLAQAEACLQQGLNIVQSIQDKAGEIFLLANLGLVQIDAGRFSLAVHTLEHGLHLAEEQGDDDLIATFQSYLGLAWVRTDQPEHAAAHATRALELRKQLGQEPLQIDDRATLALVALASGDLAQAQMLVEHIHAALISTDYVGPEFPPRACMVCYRVLRAVGNTAQATAALDAAVRLVEQRAAQIADPALRQSYCEQVPTNREILAAAGLLPVELTPTTHHHNGFGPDSQHQTREG